MTHRARSTGEAASTTAKSTRTARGRRRHSNRAGHDSSHSSPSCTTQGYGPRRPIDLNRDHISFLPPAELMRVPRSHLSSAAPHAGRNWTNDDSLRENVPSTPRRRRVTDGADPPQLASILRTHFAEFPDGLDGRLFYGVRSESLPSTTYMQAWREARKAALTPREQRSPLARRPYDLRHACVSTWLNAGVAAPQVAAWAGHGVDVLLKIYAKTIEGQEAIAKLRIEAALDEGMRDQDDRAASDQGRIRHETASGLRPHEACGLTAAPASAEALCSQPIGASASGPGQGGRGPLHASRARGCDARPRLDRQSSRSRSRPGVALGPGENLGTYWAQTPVEHRFRPVTAGQSRRDSGRRFRWSEPF